MASLRENLLFLEHLSGPERNTFTRPRGPCLKRSTAMHLQQRLQHLRERERSAQQFNRELLQQFDKAQDILREVLASNDTMKTLRVEYERYLEMRAPYWQEQLQKKSEDVHKKKMDDYFSAHLKKTEEMSKTSADLQLQSQAVTKKPQKVSSPQEISDSDSNIDYNHDFSYLASSWLIQPQSRTDHLPVRVLHPLEGPSHVPLSHLLSPSTVPHLHHFDTMLGRPSPSTHMTESPGEREVETSRGPSSKRESDGGSRSESLQDPDIRPMRLSCGHAESSESSRTSCQGNTAGREKKKKTQHVSSDSERCSSEESPGTSMNTDHTGEKTVQSSESDISSDERSMRSNDLLVDAGPPLMEKMTNEKTKTEVLKSGEEGSSSDENSGSQIEESMNEDAENHRPDKKPVSGEDDAERYCEKIQPRVGEAETQTMDSSDEQSSAEEGDDEEEKPGEDSKRDEEHKERRVENVDEVSVGESSETEDETEAESELEDEHGDQRKQSDSHSQEEDENRDEEESNDEEEEEKRSDITGEEESDSGDEIITPQVNRPKTMQNIPEADKVRRFDDEKEESEAGSLDQDSTESSEDGIENLLAPQEPRKKLETPPKVDDTPKAPCDYVERFQVEQDSPTNIIYQSDSDEFDHFYD